MQKKIIALAVAGLMSGAAFAQSNVEIYGILGAYWQNQKTTTAANVSTSVNQLRTDGQSGSRLGFRGTEDLGGGLKANFAIESALATDTGSVATASGTTGLGNRQIWVGLSGGFGAVTAGRQYSPMFNLLAGTVDNTGYADWSPVVATQAYATRIDNSVQYVSPNMSGFSARAMYAFGEDGATGTKGNNDGLGLGASYANGPIAAGLAYHQTKEQSVAGPNSNRKATALGGAYDLGMAKLYGGLTWEKTAADVKTKTWSMGVDVKVGGAGTVLVSLANRNPDGANNDTKAYQLSYQHMLSKRTNLIAGIARINLDGPTDDKRTFAGVRHAF